MASMDSRSLPRAAATSMALAIAIVFLIYTAARLGDAASVEHTFIVSMHIAVSFVAFRQPRYLLCNIRIFEHQFLCKSDVLPRTLRILNKYSIYVGEPGEDDTLVQGDAGHRGEWAAPGASDRGHRGRLSDCSCCQQVTLQHNNPLVMSCRSTYSIQSFVAQRHWKHYLYFNICNPSSSVLSGVGME
jgi:hypothetical protein